MTPQIPYLTEYLPMIVFAVVAVGFSTLLIVLAAIFAPHKPDPEKLSAYECGFAAMGDARQRFDIRFYLVSLLFIIFDLEIALLFPWAANLTSTGWQAFAIVFVFLGILTVGFIYEWKKGALEWE